MTPARSATAKKLEKNTWNIDQDRLPLDYGNNLSSIGATQTAWSAARRAVGANETDAGNRYYDEVAGSPLDGGYLEFEILALEKLGWEMLHRLSALSRS